MEFFSFALILKLNGKCNKLNQPFSELEWREEPCTREQGRTSFSWILLIKAEANLV